MVLVPAAGAGCGFVAGVDFFELERAPVSSSAPDAEGGVAPVDEAGLTDAPSVDAGSCTSVTGCASFDDCAPLDDESSRRTADAGAVLDVTRTRANSAPCSVHAELALTKDSTKRTSAYRTVRSSPMMVRTTLDFWFSLDRVDTTPPSGSTGEGRTQLAMVSFTIPRGTATSSTKVRTLLSIGPTKAYLTGDDGTASLPLAEASSAGLLGGGWHHAQYVIERTSNSTRSRFDAKVYIDEAPYLAGDVEVPVFDTTTSIEALVGLVESTAKTTAPSVFIDDVRLVTMPPS